jgi:hypothetical protein
MDYSLADPTVKWARRHAIPFVSYQYKILPLLAETAKNRPWVLGMHAAMPMAMMEVVKAVYGDTMSEKDWKDLESQIPKETLRRHTWAIIPWKIHGEWHWFDYSYFMPWGNLLSASTNVAQGDVKGAISQLGIGGTPVLNVTKMFGTGVVGNKAPTDPYTGQPIYRTIDSASTKMTKTMEALYNLMAPGMLTRYGTLGYALDMGSEDRYGRKIGEIEPALRLMGINVNEPNARQAAVSRKAQVEAIKHELISVLLNPKMGDDEKAEYAARAQREILEIMEYPEE